MKTSFLRTLVALGALATLSPFATADQRGFGNLLGQWSNQQSNQQSSFDADQASYASDGASDQVLPAYSEQFAGNGGYGPESYAMYGGVNACSCESCQGGYDGSYGSCDGGCYDGSCYSGDCYSGNCDSNYCGNCNQGCGNAAMCYFEIQNIFLRPHVSSDVAGKLRENYEYSPRFILGYETPSGLGARGRYWTYSHTTSTVGGSNSLGLDFDVIDVEGTARFSSQRADLLVSGGVRWAHIVVEEDNEDAVGTEMPGITFAADGRLRLCGTCSSQWSAVAGARWSLLGGDWKGDSNNVIEPTFDDNVNVQEIYGGVEYLRHLGSCDVYARAVFEVQNWHSDALGATTSTDSLGFIGPSIQAGVSY